MDQAGGAVALMNGANGTTGVSGKAGGSLAMPNGREVTRGPEVGGTAVYVLVRM